MLHVPATVEEQLLLKAIKEECPWENLPKRLQVIFNTREEWHRRITEHCIKKRLLWNTSFAREVCKENDYYEEMMRYLRRNLGLFPYHLAEYVCRVMRISPFRYYCDIIFEVMKNEQPYDSIPNFSAADALRITGVGRNEFIDIMNKCRSKKITWKLNKSIAKELLPTQPVDFPIEPWWGICLVNFTLEEFKKLSEEETAILDKICKEEANAYFLFDPDVIRGLYRRGLIYFDVPVYHDDRFKVSRLEGFISNKEQSYEDPIEELLYAVFVVSNENSTVDELGATLQADLSQLQAAASFVCRLGWAEKVIDPSSILRDTKLPTSHRVTLTDEDDASFHSTGSAEVNTNGGDTPRRGDSSVSENFGSRSADSRVAFVVDANITSYLMMGSVSPGLKSHAVALYEAGKLGHDSIADLCKDLSTLEGKKFEGELQEFANHAFSLRCVLECLLSGGVAPNSKVVEVCDKMGTVASNSNGSASLVADISLTEKSEQPGINKSQKDGRKGINSRMHPEASVLAEIAVKSAGDETASSYNLNSQNDEKQVPREGSETGKETERKKKNFRVDILRCESLAALPKATLDRLFLRDYGIVITMVPLPYSSVLPGPTGPINFGPPSHLSMTPWLKLVLYTTVASGPLSVVLMKGQCLRMLPAPLAGCEKALIWSWDGSTVGGLGGKMEGNLVKGGILLHCINSLGKYSALIVQPLSRYDLDESGQVVTIDIPLPLKNLDGSVGRVGNELGLPLAECSKLNFLLTDLANKIELWTIGYIRLLKLFKERDSAHFAPDDEQYEWVPLTMEFGMPLFNPKLSKNICKRIVSSQLLQADSLSVHHDSMHSIRKRLRDVCAEYQATGPAAKLLYQNEQSDAHAHAPPKQFMNYASGRWNPLADISSPISGAQSESQRLKIGNRNRCKTEILSFDGSILRSYALSPAYEAATRSVDSPTQNIMKVDPDETDSREPILPGVNLIFDGSSLHPFDIAACVQARQPISLIADAASSSASILHK